jgi:hypothetical protein
MRQYYASDKKKREDAKRKKKEQKRLKRLNKNSKDAPEAVAEQTSNPEAVETDISRG